MSEMEWVSPDGKIIKYIISKGEWGLKPTENCVCNIKICDCSSADMERYCNISEVIIGDSIDSFERSLHLCLVTMHRGEKSKCVINLAGKKESFMVNLLSFETNGLIYEWDARKKYDLALNYKLKGNNLYKDSCYIDASHYFGKALKILCSIPIQVDESPSSVDDVNVQEIHILKSTLYNNLASCYIKHGEYDTVIGLCQKVLDKDCDNIKALYKQGFAKCEIHDYEGAYECLIKVIKIEPANKAVLEKLTFVNSKIAQSNTEIKNMIQKMFSR